MIIGFPLFLLFKARHFCRAIIKFGEVLLSHFFYPGTSVIIGKKEMQV